MTMPPDNHYQSLLVGYMEAAKIVGRKELDEFRAAERKRFTELVKASGVSIK